MSNLTIAVDDELIKRARIRAIQQGTSLSAKVREFLQQYVDETEARLAQQRVESTARLMAAIEAATAATPASAPVTGMPARRSLRAELYDSDFRRRDASSSPASRRGTKAG